MKRYLFIILMVLSVATVSGQTHYQPHISIGGRAGMSLGEMSFSPSVKQKWNKGTTGAVTFRYTEEKLFGLIAEIGWVQRGWAENYEELPLSYSRTLTYIDIPLLTHIYFGSKRFKAFFNLGPQVSILVGSSIDSNFDYKNPGSVSGYPKNRQTEQLWADEKNKFDYGICASVGFEFFVQPRHSVLVEGRYYYGLGNIYPAAKADTFSASRNMSIEVSLGYFFKVK